MVAKNGDDRNRSAGEREEHGDTSELAATQHDIGRLNAEERRPGQTGHAEPSDTAREREAQDRERGPAGHASSPVDSMHVDAPKKQDNEHGHRRS